MRGPSQRDRAIMIPVIFLKLLPNNDRDHEPIGLCRGPDGTGEPGPATAEVAVGRNFGLGHG